ncbi:MAG TPA: hypothetical protein VFN20_15320, partial [Candidatus Acidoferrum sp.]|nr:hypothetical protein [Candidatus Acidoferrum sp.]
ENAGERIVEFVAQDFSEGVGKRGVRRRGESGIANFWRKAARSLQTFFASGGGGQFRLRGEDGSESRESRYVSQWNSLSGKHLTRQTWIEPIWEAI